MMRLETSTDDFSTIIRTSSKLMDEIKLECDQDGVRFSGLDKSHICFMCSEFQPNHFLEYDCPEPVSLIIDTTELVKVFSRKKKDDKLIIRDEKDNLVI